MPYKPADPTFYDADGYPLTYFTTSIAEPVSPDVETLGTAVSMTDTPLATTETYRALRCAGPAAARIDLKLDAGAFADASGGIAVGGTVGTERSLEMRVVALPYVAAGDNPQVWFAVVACDSGEADWLGTAPGFYEGTLDLMT
jgi:hypothetical protein